MKGVKHYKKDGTEHKGGSHKMPDGSLHTGKAHSKTSVKLFHLKDLSKTVQAKLKKKVVNMKEGGLAASQKSLKSWTKQDWRTKSGKPSTQGKSATGERYLPTNAIKAMDAGTYASSTAKKRKDTAEGKQFSKQPKSAAKTTKSFRRMT
tara:strand:+ start:498 stop:944 length:447 start_codon:yes stop_codon:yes gene_type:complete